MTTTDEGRSTRRTPTEVAERRQAAADLKKRFDPWVEKLGGWEKPGMKSDLAAMAAYLIKDDEEPITAGSLGAWVTNWLKDNNLGVQGLGAFEKLNAIFEASSDVHATYIEYIRRANGAIELPEGVDWPFTIEQLPLSKLFADETYQRPIDSIWVRSMLIGFDERLVGTIDVSARKGGKFAIMDGRQRHETMTQIGKQTCWATIYHGMDVATEADFFFRKNRNRKQMHAFYAFRARALSGDSTSRLIEEIVATSGFRLGATPNDDTITAIRAIEDIYDLPTETSWGNALAPTLTTAKKCWYGRSSALDGTLLRGLARFFSYYGAEELQMRHFEDSLTALGPVLIIGRARDSKDQSQTKYIGSRIDVAMATTFAEIHNAGLPRAERINLDRIPRPIRQRARRR